VAHNVAIYFAKIGLCPQYRPSAIEQRVDLSVPNLFHREKQPGTTVTTRTDHNSLVFSNPIGLAAGFDKDGMIVSSMLLLGFGFVEIGTVTPLAQEGNPKPRMFRLQDDQAIINRYGFNSSGNQVVLSNLQQYRHLQQQARLYHYSTNTKLPWYDRIYYMIPSIQQQQNLLRDGIVGVNIGKNKTSETDEATIQDYITNIQTFAPYADYLVINISSPNTARLRTWQQPDALERLLQSCIQARDDALLSFNEEMSKTPILIKLSPDLNESELIEIANVCLKFQVDGIIVSNTTNQRPHDLISAHHIQNQSGGLSGRPLKDRSTECIRILYKATNGGMIPIIGVGGISNGYDAYEKFKAGASLIQIYSSLIYEGPGIVQRIRTELAHLLIQHGQRSLQHDVIGLDHDDIFWKKQQIRQQQKESNVNVIVIDEENDNDITDEMPSLHDDDDDHEKKSDSS
jgi:dihydroorotate dehydrogenase